MRLLLKATGLKTSGFLFLLLGCILAIKLPTHSQEPEPFRTDEIQGRDFDYNSESFLQRFSYRYRPTQDRQWKENKEGLRSTVGSVRSDDFYVLIEAQKTVTFEDPLYFVYRFKRDEDFDSRLNRNLIGFGSKLTDNWSLTALGDLEGDKENIDAHFELVRKQDDTFLRLAFIATDLTFNDKQDQSEYQTQPFTYFIETLKVSSNGMRWYSFVNYNSRLKLENMPAGGDFSYEQFNGGFEMTLPLSNRSTLSISPKGEYGTRSIKGNPAPILEERRFTRRNLELTAQLDHQVNEELSRWLGLRYFSLSERDLRSQNLSLDRRTQRRENMIFGGISWKVRPKVLFWPGVYLNFINNRERFPSNPAINDRDQGFVGKLNLPFEISAKSKSSLTINPTLSLHRLAFGGMNVQTRIIF